MEKKEQANSILLFLAALLIVSVNAGIWLAARQGIVAALDNAVLWCAFVVFGAISVLWAIHLLGLQPLLVAVSYVSGGAVAYLGVRGLDGIGLAEATAAGATYGAFGALVIGNAATKERAAGYRKSLASFVFMLLVLLVLDGILISRVLQAGAAAIMNALVFPLVVVGLLFGVIWVALGRFRVERFPVVPLAVDAEGSASEKAPRAEPVSGLVLQMPEESDVEGVELGEPSAVSAPVIETPEPPAEPEVEAAEFFPLGIDPSDSFVLPQELKADEDDEPTG